MLGEIQNILKQYWGYESFRPLQAEAMLAACENRDSLVVMPTGGGKSLCFQAPAIVLDGVALVVSPLISLMNDQVDALKERHAIYVVKTGGRINVASIQTGNIDYLCESIADVLGSS